MKFYNKKEFSFPLERPKEENSGGVMKNIYLIKLTKAYKEWSFSRKVIIIVGILVSTLVLILEINGKLNFVDGLLLVLLPVLGIMGILLFMIKLINASFFERDYRGRISPVYRRLLKNREKIGRDK